MKNFYFRSILLKVLIIGLVFVLGCSYVPTIVPVKNAASVSQAVVDVKPLQEKPKDSVQGDSGITHNDHADSQQEKQDEQHKVVTDLEQKELDIDFNEQPIISIDPSTKAEEEAENSLDEEIINPIKRMALTFDDGPDLKYTPQILDILKEKNVKATFFIVGVQIKKYPEIVQRMVEEGHLIGNHSYYHPNFTTLSKDKLIEEIETTDQLIEAAVGFVPEVVRPPYGAMNKEVRAILEDLGKEVVLWNIDTRDWASTPMDEMYENVMSNAKDNGNILFHSFGGKQIQNTVDILPKIIDDLQSQGYTFVTVDELE